ncbi:MAG TPA: N-acetylmuramoyl-L-alanine amidase [Solirubrobacteraceae bacterium]
MRRLAAALVAAGLLLWFAAPGLSVRPLHPRVVEFSQALTRESVGAHRWRSGVVRAPKRFDLVGLTWSAPRSVRPRIRVRDGGGHWSRWTLMAANHAGASGAEPVWAGGADAYELRLDRRPRDLRAHFVNSTGTATGADRVRTAMRQAVHDAVAAVAGTPAVAQNGGGAPAIIPREWWAADQCPPRAPPAYGQVQMGFVHHTVGANGYNPQDSAAIVLAICRFHRNVNKWRDVGYNFLVDRYGQIFEGRAGGVDQPVIGAQAQGFNGVSTGVANIGTFSAEPQTAEGVAATSALLAWKLTLHGAPVSGQVALASSGGPTSRYRAGTAVTFERISGHRDADKTACPGDALFAQLPEIRTRAAALVQAIAPATTSALTIDALDRTLEFPQAAELSGRASATGGAPVAGAPIAVQMATRAGFQTLARTATGDFGTWSAQLPTQFTRTLRAVTQSADGTWIASPSLSVQVAPRIRLRAARRVIARRAFTVSGSMLPRRERLVLAIAREGTDEQMHTVARVGVKVRQGRFRIKVRLRRPALHRLRVASMADAHNIPGRSGDVYLRAVRPNR